MVRRSSRVSRKSRSKVNRKMKRSRKVSRRVNKSRRVNRRKTKRVNKSRRVSRKRTKRVNKSRRISRKRTKRVNNKRTKRVSRKRTREIEGGVKGFKSLKSALRGSTDTSPSQPVSPVSESELSEEEQHAKKTALLKRINSGDKSAITEYYQISQSFNHDNQNEIQQAINEMFERETMGLTQRKETETETETETGTGTGTERLEASELLTKTDDFLRFITIKLPNEHDTTRKKLEKLLSDAKESVGNQEDTKNYEQAKKLLFRRVIQPLIDFIKSIATKFDATLDESKYAGKSYSDLLTFAEELITDESGKKREELERELKEVMGLKKGAEETLETKYPEIVKNAEKVVEDLKSKERNIKSKQTSLKLKEKQLNEYLESKKNNELLPLFNGIDTLVTDYERLEAKAAEAQAAAKEEFEGQRRLIAEKQAKAAAEKEREENRKKRRKEREAAAEEEKERKRLEAERLKAERLEAEASAAEAAASAAEAAAAAAAASKKEEKERLQAAAAAETEETERFIANKKEERERKVRSAEIAQKFKDLLNSNSYNADTDKPEYLSDFGPEWELYHSVLEDSENSTLKSDLNTFFVKAEDLKSEGISDYDLLVYLINEHKLLEEESLIGLDGGIPSTKDFSSWPDMGLDRSRAKNMIKKLLILELLHMTPELEFLREIFRINFDD